jgi:hypothetical protein
MSQYAPCLQTGQGENRNRARSQSDSTGILTLIGVKSYNPDV